MKNIFFVSRDNHYFEDACNSASITVMIGLFNVLAQPIHLHSSFENIYQFLWEVARIGAISTSANVSAAIPLAPVISWSWLQSDSFR